MALPIHGTISHYKVKGVCVCVKGVGGWLCCLIGIFIKQLCILLQYIFMSSRMVSYKFIFPKSNCLQDNKKKTCYASRLF